MSDIIATPYSARARVASLHAKRPNDRAAISNARRDLAAANVAAAIQRNLAAAPPLSDDQVERLSDLLRGSERERSTLPPLPIDAAGGAR